jgi:hypothetical protein
MVQKIMMGSSAETPKETVKAIPRRLLYTGGGHSLFILFCCGSDPGQSEPYSLMQGKGFVGYGLCGKLPLILWLSTILNLPINRNGID